jgi:hypothetical protein
LTQNTVCHSERSEEPPHLLLFLHLHLLLFLPLHLLVLFHSNQKTVISTEAAHGLIVSSAVEKSASLPPRFANPYSAVAVAFAFQVEPGFRGC